MNGWILLIFAISSAIATNAIEVEDLKLPGPNQACSDTSEAAARSTNLILEETIFYGLTSNCELFYFLVALDQTASQKEQSVRRILLELEAKSRNESLVCYPDEFEVILRRDKDGFVFETFQRDSAKDHILTPLEFGTPSEGVLFDRRHSINVRSTGNRTIRPVATVGGFVSIAVAKPSAARPYAVYLKNVTRNDSYRCFVEFSAAENLPFVLRSYVLSSVDKVTITRLRIYGHVQLLSLSFYTFINSLIYVIIFVAIIAVNFCVVGFLARSAKKLNENQQKIESFLDECLGETKVPASDETPLNLEVFEPSASVSREKPKKIVFSGSVKRDSIKLSKERLNKSSSRKNEGGGALISTTKIATPKKGDAATLDVDVEKKAPEEQSKGSPMKTDLRSLSEPIAPTPATVSPAVVPARLVAAAPKSESKAKGPPSDCSLKSETESVRTSDLSALGISGKERKKRLARRKGRKRQSKKESESESESEDESSEGSSTSTSVSRSTHKSKSKSKSFAKDF